MNILNLGCGGQDPKTQESFNLDENDEVFNFDVSPAATWRNITGDALTLPFVESAFDLCYCSHVLEHIRDPYKVLKELLRVTSDGGVLRVPNGCYYRFMKEDKEHLFSWTKESFENLIVASGWRVGRLSARRFQRNNNIVKKILFNISTLLLGKNELIAIILKD